MDVVEDFPMAWTAGPAGQASWDAAASAGAGSGALRVVQARHRAGSRGQQLTMFCGPRKCPRWKPGLCSWKPAESLVSPSAELAGMTSKESGCLVASGDAGDLSGERGADPPEQGRTRCSGRCRVGSGLAP